MYIIWFLIVVLHIESERSAINWAKKVLYCESNSEEIIPLNGPPFMSQKYIVIT